VVAARSFVNGHASNQVQILNTRKSCLCEHNQRDFGVLLNRVGILLIKRRVVCFMLAVTFVIICYLIGVRLNRYMEVFTYGILQAHRLPTDVIMRQEEYLSAPSPILENEEL